MTPLPKRILTVMAAGAVVGLGATAAEAQSRYTYSDRGSDWSVRAQRDRPGDYRCDAFWDANRTDCDARWRDQRHRTSYGYSYSRSYRGDYGYRGHDRRYGGDHGYGYGYGHDRGYRREGGTAHYGAYGRPDVVYSSGDGYGSRYGSGRDPHRIEWCRRNYRSYDVRSGYYRAYSGRLVYCG